MKMLLKNTKAVLLDPPSVTECDIRIVDGEITKVAPGMKPTKDEETIDLSGKWVMPGFVNAHTHLYSALSSGMPGPKSHPRNFVEILQKVWWKLDEALDDESIYYSALAGSIASVKCGTTTLVDHHASPNVIHNSLDRIKEGMARIGLRGVLCYETTDRGGMKKRDQGLEENERFLTENTNNAHFRGAIGAHASLTLIDESMKKLGELAETYGTGVHIHVAEDEADVVDARKRYRTGLVQRLDKFGILRKNSIFAHGVHLDQGELSRIERSGAWMIHNPRSNMNNRIGHAPLKWFGRRSALGTDGFPSDMFEESKFGHFRNTEADSKASFNLIPALLQNGQRLVSEYFGRPFGQIAKGFPADLVVLDYDPSTPVHSRNLTGHFLFGMSGLFVQHVMIDGNWVVWDRQIPGIDETSIMERARKVASKLWKRMNG